MQFIADL